MNLLKMWFLTAVMLLGGVNAWAAGSTSVTLRPTHIDLSAATSESAVLVTLSGYPQNDVRYRLYNGSNQYNCWDGNAYVTSNSYAAGPLVVGTPTTSTTFWILFQRGNNDNTAASYRDRIGGSSSNNNTVALSGATSITSSYTLSGSHTANTGFDNSKKYVALAFNGTTLVSAGHTALTTGDFSIVIPSGTSIDKIEIRDVDNTTICEQTGNWSSTTAIGALNCSSVNPPAIAAPTISPAGDNVTAPVNVTISAEEGTAIYYTTNGDTPTASSTPYTGSFTVSATTTVKAIAVKGSDVSSIATAIYTFPVSIADFLNQAGGNVLLNPVAVVYKNGLNLYVKDASGYLLVYGSSDADIQAGDVISGLTGTYGVYGQAPQMTNASYVSKTAGTTVAPEPFDLANILSTTQANDHSRFVRIENVQFTSTTAYSTTSTVNGILSDGTTVRDNFRLGGTYYEGQNYTVVGFINFYNGTAQIFPIEITDSTPVVCNETPDVDDVAAEAAQNAISLSSDILSEGGDECVVMEKGFVYSTSNQEPVIGGTDVTKLVVAGTDFEATINNLTCGLTYYIRAYATNSFGTAYSNNIATPVTDACPTYTVTFNYGAGSGEVQSSNDASITLPEAIINCGDWTFAGWATEVDASTFVANPYTPTADITLYAVYSKTTNNGGGGSGNYELVTGAPTDWSGDYLIATNDAAGIFIFDGSLATLDAVNNYVTPGANLSGSSIAKSWGDNYKFTFTAVTDGYTAQSASGNYISKSANSNGMDSSAGTLSINFNSEDDVRLVASGGTTLRFNTASNQDRFRFYTNASQQAIYLYKLAGGGSTEYSSNPAECNIPHLLSFKVKWTEADIDHDAQHISIKNLSTDQSNCMEVYFELHDSYSKDDYTLVLEGEFDDEETEKELVQTEDTSGELHTSVCFGAVSQWDGFLHIYDNSTRNSVEANSQLRAVSGDYGTHVATYSIGISGITTVLDNSIKTSAKLIRCYSVMGIEIDCEQPGIVIKQYSDGSVKKEFVK